MFLFEYFQFTLHELLILSQLTLCLNSGRFDFLSRGFDFLSRGFDFT